MYEKTGRWFVTVRGCDSRTGKFARTSLYDTKEEAEKHAEVANSFRHLKATVTPQTKLKKS